MAVRTLQYGLVFAVGFCLILPQVFTEPRNSPLKNATLSLQLTDPQDVIVARGQSAKIRCFVYGKESSYVDIRWLYNGKIVFRNDTRFQLLDDGTLWVPKVAGKKVEGTLEGSFQCFVRNEFGALLSSPAKLQVAVLAKEFLEEPKDVTIKAGQPTVLPCRIKSYPTPSVTWVHNRLPLPHTARHVPLPSGSLLITSIHSTDAGSYSCYVENPIIKNKPKESNVGHLTVSSSSKTPASPKILPLGFGPNVTTSVGNDVKLYCIFSGWPTPTIRWYKGNQPILSNDTVLTLMNVTGNTTGYYRCDAQNDLGKANQTFYVAVQQAPYFNHTMESIKFPPPATLRTPCHAFGLPTPNVYWLVNGTKLEYGDDRIKFVDNQLYLSNTLASDAGIYQCVAENAAGRSWIAVQYYAKISKGVIPAAPVDVQCRPYNDTGVCVSWKLPPNLSPQAYMVYSYHAGRQGPQYLTNLTYKLASGLNASTTYSFFVRLYLTSASNPSDSAECTTGTLGNRNLHVQLHNHNSVNLTWQPISSDFSCDSSPVGYRIHWKCCNTSFSTILYLSETNTTILSGFEMGVCYKFRISSINEKSAFCEWVPFMFSSNTTISTQDLSFEKNGVSAPYDFYVKAQSSNTIELYWNVNRTNASYFLICVFQAYSDKNCKSEDGARNETSSFNNTLIKNLKPSTIYEFTLWAVYHDESLSEPLTIEAQTLREGPVIIQDLKYKIMNMSTVCVKWRAPYHRNGRYIPYNVIYSSNNSKLNVITATAAYSNESKPCWIDQRDGKDMISVLLYDLDPEKLYTLKIEPGPDSAVLPPPNIVLTTRPINKHTAETNVGESDTVFKQKLGIALGMSIALCGVVCSGGCLACIITKRRKARASSCTRFYASEKRSQATQLKTTEGCLNGQEMQNLLIAGSEAPHSPTVTPSMIDSKGAIDYPRKHMNGSVLKQQSRTLNGHVHIMENPQYCPYDRMCTNNGRANTKNNEQDSISDSNIPTKLCRLKHNVTSQSTESLNTTEIIYLDDSNVLQASFRKVSAPLGPNG